MGNFYTKKGDRGRSYVGKKSVYKADPFVVALGELDQLNSLIGILKSSKIKLSLRKTLHQTQEDLFIIQANLAYLMLKEKRKPPVLGSRNIKKIEEIIDGIESKLKPIKSFIIPGTTNISAQLDYLRAFSRSAERAVLLALSKNRNKINPDILAYINRLSSLFFALARWEARNKKEKHPKYY